MHHMNTSFPWVAVVDDDAFVRAASVRLLGICGFLATGFQNAGDFLRAVEVSAPGCALLDVHMPAMDGFELQQELHQISPITQVVFMTGDDTKEWKEYSRRTQ